MQVETQAVKYLKMSGIAASARGVSKMLVDSDRRGIATVTMRVDVPAADTTKAMHAIEQLDAAFGEARAR